VHRVLIVSHTYVNPANRGKLRALAARGLDVTVGVPQRFREPALGRTVETGGAPDRRRSVPIPARGYKTRHRAIRGRALAALLRDKRPDLIQVEEEATTRMGQQAVRVAAGSGSRRALHQSERGAAASALHPLAPRRALRRLRGAVAGSEGAAT